jgi:hypothetical protein
MLFRRNSVATGVSSPPRLGYDLPSVDKGSAAGKAATNPPSRNPFQNHFRTTAQIPYTAGGSYGREFRAN